MTLRKYRPEMDLDQYILVLILLLTALLRYYPN